FRIKYTDDDDEAPTSIQVWIDRNDNGDYLDANEKENMTETDAGDTTYTDGKLYALTLTVSYAGDGSLPYLFYATDGTDPATGTPTSASTLTVTDPLEVPGEYGTIQAAINASVNGDYVLVSDGTYGENIDFIGKNITVLSVNGSGSTTITGTGTNDAVVSFENSETSSAILDGFTIDNSGNSSATRGILISGATPTIKNSIITGNAAGNTGGDSATNCYGGGGVCIVDSVPTFDNVTITSNSATNRHGCGMYIHSAGGGAVITNSTIGVNGSPNNCSNGAAGGIYYTGATTGSLTISDSNIQYNQSAQNGTGIYLTNINTTTTITDTNITNNTGGGNVYGAGIYASNAPLSITGGSISNNAGGVNRGGGGIYATGTGGISISGTTINSNTGGSYGGGAIYLTSFTAASPLTISNSTISSNFATGSGGGLFLSGVTNAMTITNTNINSNSTGDGGYGGGIYLSSSTLDVTGGTISSNNAGLNRGGGAVYITSSTATFTGTEMKSNDGGGNSFGGGAILMEGTSPSMTLTRATIQGNGIGGGGTHNGGGICVKAGTATITNTIVAGNHSGAGFWSSGGGIYNNATMYIYHSTIADNWAQRRGGGIYIGTGGTTTIDGSLLWDNNATDANTDDIEDDGNTNITYSAIESGKDYTDGGGNITSITGTVFTTNAPAGSGSPTTNGNYHLKSDAVEIIDSADPSSTVDEDMDGHSRPVDGPGTGGSVNDMGADEYDSL
ncbi:MAG: hypothetical protein GTO60_02500, partial [Gammaproteobacteria bacterium]|nr:hypothetical protein [Gammaproteobacteria bacterium]